MFKKHNFSFIKYQATPELRDIRKKREKTIDDVAAAVGISRTMYHFIEKGTRMATESQYVKIMKYLTKEKV